MHTIFGNDTNKIKTELIKKYCVSKFAFVK